MKPYTMTWGEMFRLIRGGDVGMAMILMVECAIMFSPVVLIGGAYLWSN